MGNARTRQANDGAPAASAQGRARDVALEERLLRTAQSSSKRRWMSSSISWMAVSASAPSQVIAELRSLAGGQHHQAHDALSVDLLPVPFDPDFAFVTVADLDEHRRGTSVQTEPVQNGDFLGTFWTEADEGLRLRMLI